MKVDSHIVRAIEQFMADTHTSCEDFAKQTGVSNASVTKWRKVGSGITHSRWQVVFPLIRKYLPQDKIYIDDAGREQYSSATAKQSAYFFEPKYIPLMVPTFTVKQIATYDDTLESITQFGIKNNVSLSEYRPKHKDKSSVFAISIDKATPAFPGQATLFVCAGERPSNSGMVVAQAGGKIIIGAYKRVGDNFEIVSIDGKDRIEGQVKDAKKLISWTYPVLYYEVVTF